jgi:8-oxo-dGTP pyrophosphatase MutT (NUDIX family)
MNTNGEWTRLNRKLVYDTKFLKVYEDRIKLPTGSIIDDYTVVEKPSIVMVVATTRDKHVVILHEYKYAANKVLLTLPAGHKKIEESPIEAAGRELREETGYTTKEFEELGVLLDYPTKDLHKVFVVHAKNITKTSQQHLEETESLSYQLVPISDLRKQIVAGEWQASSALAALVCSGILF